MRRTRASSSCPSPATSGYRSSNHCLNSFEETQNCSTKIPVSVKNTEWCGDNYTEVYDLTNKLLSRIKKTEIGDLKRVDVSLSISNFSQYCPHCYNRVKDVDEEGIDCGGSCVACIEKTPAKVMNFFWIWWILLLLLILVVLYLSRQYIKDKRMRDLKNRIHGSQ